MGTDREHIVPGSLGIIWKLNEACHWIRKAFKTQKELHHCITTLKVLNTKKRTLLLMLKKNPITFLRLIKFLILKKDTINVLKFLIPKQDSVTFLWLLKLLILITSLRPLTVLILKNGSISFLCLLEFLILKNDFITFMTLKVFQNSSSTQNTAVESDW